MKKLAKRSLAVLLSLLMVLSVLGAAGTLPTAKAEPLAEVSYLAYNTATGEFEARSVTDYTVVDANTDLNAAGVYVVQDDVALNAAGINVTGAADAEWSLILCDGATLTVNGSVTLSGMPCRVYGQTQGTGMLKITGAPDRDNLFRNNSPFELHGGRVEICVEAGIRKACIYNAAAFTVYGGSLSCSTPNYTAVLLQAEFAVYGGLVEAEGNDYGFCCNNDKNGVITLGEGMYCYTGKSSSAELHDVVPITAMDVRYKTYSLRFVSEYVKITDETPPPAADKSDLQYVVDEYADDYALASVIYPTYYAALAPLYENAAAVLASETAGQGAVDTAYMLLWQDGWVENMPLFLRGMKYLDVPKEPVLNGVYQLDPAENTCCGDIIAFPDGETTFVHGYYETYSFTGPVGVYARATWDAFADIKLMDYKTSTEYFIRTDVGVHDITPWGLRLTGGDGTETNPYTFEVLIEAPWDEADLTAAMIEAADYWKAIRTDCPAAAETLKAAIIAAKDARYDPLATQDSFDAAEETLRAALAGAKKAVNAETFAAYQAEAIKTANAQSADGDSEAAAKLIAAAVTAIGETEYNGNLTLEANEAVIDAILADLTAGLADRRAADEVIALIDDIGEVEYTDESKAKIDEAKEAYDALTDGQKALVENYGALEAAEASYAELKAEAEKPTEPETPASEGPGVCELCGETHDTSTISGFIIDFMHDFLFVLKQLTVGLVKFMLS